MKLIGLEEQGIKKVFKICINFKQQDKTLGLETDLKYNILFEAYTMIKEYDIDDIDILLINDYPPEQLIERCEIDYEELNIIKENIAIKLNSYFKVSDLPYRMECYTNNGMVCPYCGAESVNSYKEIPGLWRIHDVMTCGECEKEFVYVYELTNIKKED